MGKLTAGLFFILFDIQINVNGHGIGLLPAFAGYFALMRGLCELKGETPAFDRFRPYAAALGVFELALWVLHCAGILGPAGLWAALLGGISTAGRIFAANRLTIGMNDIEKRFAIPPAKEGLTGAWQRLAVLFAAAFVLRGIRGWSVISALAALLAGFSFFLRFIAAGRQYDAYRPPRHIPPRH